MIKYYIIPIALVSSLYGGVDESSFEGKNLKTSDGIHYQSQSFWWKSDRRDLSYPFEDDNNSKFHYGFKYQATQVDHELDELSAKSVSASGSYRFIDWAQVTTEIKYSQLAYSSNDDRLVGGKVSVEASKNNEYYQSLSFAREPGHESLLLPKAAQSNLTYDKLSYHLLYLKLANYRFNQRLHYYWISDGNQKWQLDVDIKRQIFKKYLWCFVGLGGEYIHHQEDIAGYWTPRHFWSLGPRLELGYDFASHFSLSHGTNLNYFYDENSSSGRGYYTTTLFRIGKRSSHNLQLGFERIVSSQNSSEWDSNQLFIRGMLYF